MTEKTSDPELDRQHAAEVFGEAEDDLNPEEEEPIRADGVEHSDIAQVVGTTDLPCGIGETDGDCGLPDDGSEEARE